MQYAPIISENRHKNPEVYRLAMLALRTRIIRDAMKHYHSGNLDRAALDRQVEDYDAALKKIRHRLGKAMGL